MCFQMIPGGKKLIRLDSFNIKSEIWRQSLTSFEITQRIKRKLFLNLCLYNLTNEDTKNREPIFIKSRQTMREKSYS